jgi:hypothetical protein
VGIAVAVVLVLVGLWLLLSSRSDAKKASSRPARDSFRAVDDTPPPPHKRLAVVLNPTKLDSTSDDVHDVIRRVCSEHGWDEPLFIETSEHDVGFGDLPGRRHSGDHARKPRSGGPVRGAALTA